MMANGVGLCAEFLLRQRSFSTTVRSVAWLIQSSLISRGCKSIASRYHLIHRLSYSRVLCVRQLHQNNGSQGHPDLLQGRNDYIIQSPYPDLEIPENISLPHFLMNKFAKYGNSTALVSQSLLPLITA